MSIPTSMTSADVIQQFSLQHYVQVLFASKSVRNPYHNPRHMLHVMMKVYRALIFYDMASREQGRPILIAALLHDLDHPGVKRDSDGDNIRDAISALSRNMLPADHDIFPQVCGYIWYTEFPHTPDPDNLVRSILQDADCTQSFADEGWVNEIFLGLSREWSVLVSKEFIDGQIGFLRGISWKTDWAKKSYPPEVIDAQIALYRKWKQILHTAV